MNTHRTRKFISLLFITILLGALVAGCASSGSASMAAAKSYLRMLPAGNLRLDSTPIPGEEAPVSRFYQDYDDISFYYVSSVATKVTGKTVEASLDVSNPINPKMDQFEFQNYAVFSQIKPRINVFPVQEFVKLGGDSASKKVYRLSQMIASQPVNPPGEMPMLLGEPNGQLMHAGMEYLKFQNGSGIRYLTQYGEQPWPMDNNLLFYTFQGLTEDGGFYISAVLPVNHPPLEGDDGLVRMQEDYTKFQSNYPVYVDYIQKQLNAEQANSFTPNLASLDAMIKSLSVNKRAPEAGPTSKPTATPTKPPSGCTNEAGFVADVTIPDDTSLQPGTTFKKTWRLKNIGTCTWNANYKLVYIDGDPMGVTGAIKLTNGTIPPNGNLDVSVTLKAPLDPGTYQGYFKIRAQDGTIFGIEPNGANAFWVLINVVSPEPDTPTRTPKSVLPPHIITIQPVITIIIPPNQLPQP